MNFEPDGARAAALDQLKGPAIGLMVTAGIGAAFNLILLGLNLVGAGFGALDRGGRGMPSMMSGGIFAILNVLGLVMVVVVFMGASKMKNAESYGFAQSVAIIAMIPYVSPCCLLGLPLGIYALIVLAKPEVKAAFQG